MFDDLLERAASLKARDKPFVLATVVACKPPTSAKPGSKAIVQPDGRWELRTAADYGGIAEGVAGRPVAAGGPGARSRSG